MKSEIEKLIKMVCKKWDFYKLKEKPSKEWSYTQVKTLNGYTTNWDNPKLLWVFSEEKDGGYDGQGCQVGLTKEGKFVWEYQSHCSCNTFSDTNGFGDGELSLDADMSKKSYELTLLPDEWAKIVKVNLEEILKLK